MSFNILCLFYNNKHERATICSGWVIIARNVFAGVGIPRHFVGGAVGVLGAKPPKHKRVLRRACVVPRAKHDLCVRVENIVVPVLGVGFERAVHQGLHNRGVGAGCHPVFGVFHVDVWDGKRANTGQTGHLGTPRIQRVLHRGCNGNNRLQWKGVQEVERNHKCWR